MSDHPKLHITNYLNVVGYVLNFVITFAGVGGEDNATISERYQTIITPAGWAFSIWGIIFTMQAIFTFLQLLPDHRRLPPVKEGVGYWYFGTCIFQVAWTCAFSYEVLWLSVIFMALILLTLVVIVNNQSKIPLDGTNQDFWLLRFPFSIHCGWILVAFAVNVNVLVVATDAEPRTQVEWAIVSLVYIAFSAIYVLFCKRTTTIALVIAWAALAIAIELTSPIEKIDNTFGGGTITTIQAICATVCGGILCVTIIKATLVCCAHRMKEGNEDSPLAADSRHSYGQVSVS